MKNWIGIFSEDDQLELIKVSSTYVLAGPVW